MHYRKILWLGLIILTLYTFVHWYYVIRISVHPFVRMDMTQPLIDFLQHKTEIVERPDIRQYGPGYLFTIHPLLLISNLNLETFSFLIKILNSLCVIAIAFILCFPTVGILCLILVWFFLSFEKNVAKN